MSLQLTIPRRVALQQSSLPLRQMSSLCNHGPVRPTEKHRTVNPTLASCLTPGGRSREAYTTISGPRGVEWVLLFAGLAFALIGQILFMSEANYHDRRARQS